jgi:copper chaperone CopZ
MRIVILALVLAACQHVDTAEHSAKVVAERAKAPGVAAPRGPVSTMSPAVTVGTPTPAPSCGGGGGSCGGSCGDGASCGGSCGGKCGAADGATPSWNVPANAAWTDLHVAGMHCGGCAKRIERALAKVDGVLGVKVDLGTASVKVATASGIDGRKLTKATIDALGYQVQ